MSAKAAQAEARPSSSQRNPRAGGASERLVVAQLVSEHQHVRTEHGSLDGRGRGFTASLHSSDSAPEHSRVIISGAPFENPEDHVDPSFGLAVPVQGAECDGLCSRVVERERALQTRRAGEFWRSKIVDDRWRSTGADAGLKTSRSTDRCTTARSLPRVRW